MKFHDRLKLRMEERGIKAVELSKRIKATTGSISQWKSGLYVPSGNNLFALCRELRCSPEWLLYGTESEEPSDWLGGVEPWSGGTDLDEDEVELPFFNEVELSAGGGKTQVQENHGVKLRFAKSTLKKCGVDAGSAACVRVKGDSMLPVLPDGATVGVDTASTSIKDGEMYALDHEGMLRVKLAYALPGGGIRLRSYNGDEFPGEIYHGEDANNIRIIGRVFWYSVLV